MKRLIFLLLLAMPCVCDAQFKNLYGPYLQNVTDTEATIVWESSAASIGWVEMAPDDGTHFYAEERPKIFDTNIGIKRESTLHSVLVKGLQPGTTYRYRIYSQEVLSHQAIQVRYGMVAATAVYQVEPLRFTTLDPQKQETSFVVMNDIHGRRGLITQLLGVADYQNRDIIMFNGDMVSIFNQRDSVFSQFMTECVNLFAKEKCPYYVRGNHETRGEYAVHFHDYFNSRQPNLYFTFRQGPVCFICLDSGEDKPDSDIEYGGIVAYDAYRTEQAEWLTTLRDDPNVRDAKFRVVVVHMPTVVKKNNWHGGMDCLHKFTPILNEMNIDVMLCGHTHRDSFHPADNTVKYPVLVNSNNGIIDAHTNGNQLIIRVLNTEGKEVANQTFQAK